MTESFCCTSGLNTILLNLIWLFCGLYVSLDLKCVSCRQHIYIGLVLVSTQPVSVFWLDCLICFSFPSYCVLFSCDWWLTFSSVHSVMSGSLGPHGLQHTRLPCSSPTPGACSNSCPSCWWCYPTILSHLISSHPHLISSNPSLPAFNLSQHQGFFQWVSSSHQVAKILELQFQHQSFQWIFRTDFL